MVKRRKNRNRSQKAKTPARRRQRRQPTLRKRNPFTSLVKTGVRTLVSALPGSTVLLPIVDMFFSSIGFSETAVETNDTLVTLDEVAVRGLSGITWLSYANIIARASDTARNLTKGARVWFDTPYTDARLERLQITATPDNVQASRSGKWAMAFIPIRNVADITRLAADYKPLSLANVESLAGSVSANADKSISINFRPVASDGFCYQYNSIPSYFGAVVIAYGEEIRNTYSDFTASDFAPNVIVEGRVKMLQPILTGSTTGYEDAAFSPQIGAYVQIYDKKLFVQNKPSITYSSILCSSRTKKKSGRMIFTGVNCTSNDLLPPAFRKKEEVDLDVQDVAMGFSCM